MALWRNWQPRIAQDDVSQEVSVRLREEPPFLNCGSVYPLASNEWKG